MTLSIGKYSPMTLEAGVWSTDQVAVSNIDQRVSITNNTASPIYFGTADIAPANAGAAEGNIQAGQTLNGLTVYNKLHLLSAVGGVAVILTSDARYDYSPFPMALLGGSRNGARRLRVDIGKSGFYEGREFRTFKELSIAAGGTYMMRFVVGVNIVMHKVDVTCDAGSIRLTSQGGGTPTGTFSETLPVIAKNSMTEVPKPVYASQVTITAVPTGGSLSGGVIRDAVRLVAGVGQSSTVAAIGDGPNQERGIAPGTYYFLFENFGTGTTTGVFHCHWEERP